MSHHIKESIAQTEIVQKGKRGVRHLIFGRSLVIFLALLIQLAVLFVGIYAFLRRIPLLGSMTVFTAVMLLYILNTREEPTVKLTWSVVIAVLPVFGTILYIFTRVDMGHRLEKRVLQRSIDESTHYAPDQSALMAAVAAEDKELHRLACYLQTHGGTLYGNTQAQYFPLGEDQFAQMRIQLEKAENFIFLEYFSIAPGYMWDTILEILTRKASQGVEVRVMYDGSCAVSYLPPDYPKELEKRGIRCKVFSPFRPMVSTHYNNRDHRKILVIDGTTAFTGGVNLLDRYINKEEVFGHWKDTAVMVRGDAAQGFTMMFLQMWNADEKEKRFAPYLTEPRPGNSAQGYVIPYADSPLDNEQVGEMVYLNILNHARDYVYIMTPYLILDNRMLTALTFAAKRGVDVRLILPHIPDKKYAFALAKSHYGELLEAGVKVYEYTPGFVHAKVFLCDDREAVVGTINLDYRSLYLHFECAAYLYRVPALADIRRDFDETMEKSQQVTMADVRRQSLISRLAGIVLKVAAPLM